MFHSIEVICYEVDYRSMFTKYQDEQKTLQHNVIEYLKIVTGRFADISMETSVVNSDHNIIDGEGRL